MKRILFTVFMLTAFGLEAQEFNFSCAPTNTIQWTADYGSLVDGDPPYIITGTANILADQPIVSFSINELPPNYKVKDVEGAKASSDTEYGYHAHATPNLTDNTIDITLGYIGPVDINKVINLYLFSFIEPK